MYLLRSQTCIRALLLYITIVLVIATFPPPPCWGQEGDHVIVLRSGTRETAKRVGTIVDWRGDALLLSTEQRERSIPNEEIVEIQTTWPKSYLEAKPLMASGQFQAASVQLSAALTEEQRPWAQHIVRADLVRVLSALDQHESAIQHFLMMVQDDPKSRFFPLCPLKWVSTTSLPPATVQDFLKSSHPVEQLIGASWSLPGSQQAEAIKVLEQLAVDLDPRIGRYATTQLWRVRAMNLSSINERQLQVWESRIQELPSAWRAGPYFLIAEFQMKLNQPDSATINWMRIPILHSDHPALSAAALFQASSLLQQQGRHDEAESLRNELKQKYLDTVWCKQLK